MDNLGKLFLNIIGSYKGDTNGAFPDFVSKKFIGIPKA
jgi:hypothetical protein